MYSSTDHIKLIHPQSICVLLAKSNYAMSLLVLYWHYHYCPYQINLIVLILPCLSVIGNTTFDGYNYFCVLYGFYFFNVINLKFFTLTKILIRRSKTNFQAKSDHCKTNGFKHYVLPCSKKSNYLMCFSGVLEPKNPLRLHNDYLKGKQRCSHSVP